MSDPPLPVVPRRGGAANPEQLMGIRPTASGDQQYNPADMYPPDNESSESSIAPSEDSLPPLYEPEGYETFEGITTGVLQNNYQFQYALSSKGGYNRNYDNQDACCAHTGVICPNDLLLGVFDGHGQYDGGNCAKFVCGNLLDAFKDSFDDYREDAAETSMEFILAVTLKKIDKALNYNPNIEDSMSGTTATVVYIDGSDGSVAWVGDSRAVLTLKRPTGRIKAVPLTVDHDLHVPAERERIQEAGATILRNFKPLPDDYQFDENIPRGKALGNDRVDHWIAVPIKDSEDSRTVNVGGLSMTRTLGNAIHFEAQMVSAEPETRHFTIDNEVNDLILFTNCVSQYLTNQAAVDLCRGLDPCTACDRLTDKARNLWLEKGQRSVDDCTIIYVSFSAQKQEPTDDVFRRPTQVTVFDKVSSSSVPLFDPEKLKKDVYSTLDCLGNDACSSTRFMEVIQYCRIYLGFAPVSKEGFTWDFFQQLKRLVTDAVDTSEALKATYDNRDYTFRKCDYAPHGGPCGLSCIRGDKRGFVLPDGPLYEGDIPQLAMVVFEVATQKNNVSKITEYLVRKSLTPVATLGNVEAKKLFERLTKSGSDFMLRLLHTGLFIKSWYKEKGIEVPDSLEWKTIETTDTDLLGSPRSRLNAAGRAAPTPAPSSSSMAQADSEGLTPKTMKKKFKAKESKLESQLEETRQQLNAALGNNTTLSDLAKSQQEESVLQQARYHEQGQEHREERAKLHEDHKEERAKLHEDHKEERAEFREQTKGLITGFQEEREKAMKVQAKKDEVFFELVRANQAPQEPAQPDAKPPVAGPPLLTKATAVVGARVHNNNNGTIVDIAKNRIHFRAGRKLKESEVCVLFDGKKKPEIKSLNAWNNPLKLGPMP